MSRWKNTRMCLLDFYSLKLLHIWRKDGPKPEIHAQTLFRCFIPNIRHTWSLDPNAELPSVCLAISKAWQTSPWECQSKITVGSGSHAVFQRVFIGGIFYMVLLLEVKSQLPGSEKWWLGLILVSSRADTTLALKIVTFFVPIFQCELLYTGLFFQEYLTLRQTCSKMVLGLWGYVQVLLPLSAPQSFSLSAHSPRHHVRPLEPSVPIPAIAQQFWSLRSPHIFPAWLWVLLSQAHTWPYIPVWSWSVPREVADAWDWGYEEGHMMDPEKCGCRMLMSVVFT